MMTTQKKKPLPGQHRKVGPLTEKVEPIMAPHPQLEVLQERMNHLATREQMNATTAQMNKLHGEAMERIGEMASDLRLIKWIGGALGSAIIAGLIAIIAGFIKLFFFPVV